VRRRDRDPPLALLGSLVDLVERHELRQTLRFARIFVIAAVNVVLPWST
jgi:hypothetical protein